MTFSTLLIHTCDIQRFAEGAQDGYGQPSKVWSNLHTDLACRKVYGKGTEITIGQEVLIINDELYIEDVDVTTQDRVVIDSITYEILDIAQRSDGIGAHHKKLYIRGVK